MSVTNFNYFTLLLLAFVQIPECEKAAFSFQTLKSSCQRRLLFDLHHVVVLTVALPSVANTEITTFFLWWWWWGYPHGWCFTQSHRAIFNQRSKTNSTHLLERKASVRELRSDTHPPKTLRNMAVPHREPHYDQLHQQKSAALCLVEPATLEPLWSITCTLAACATLLRHCLHYQREDHWV